MIVHHLSPKGIDLLNQGARIHREYLKAAFGPLSTQEKTGLLRVLQKLLSRAAVVCLNPTAPGR